MLDALNNFALLFAIRTIRSLRGSPRLISWTWDTIKGYGSTRALKASYVFLFAVPALARALEAIPDSVTIPIWGKSFDIALELPFSWVVLFWSACLASLGNIVYATMCPELVKQFSDFPAYRSAARDGTHLRSTVSKLALLGSGASVGEQLTSVRDLYNDVPIRFDNLEGSLEGQGELSSAQFYFVRDAANLAQPLTRLVASCAYFGAFICLGILAMQNVVYVVEYLRTHAIAG